MARARLAQSAERKALNLVVVGSSPTVGAGMQKASVNPFFSFFHFLRQNGQGQDRHAKTENGKNRKNGFTEGFCMPVLPLPVLSQEMEK